MINYHRKLKRIAEIRNNLDSMSDALRDELYLILKSSKDRVVSAAVIQALYLAQIELENAPILFFGKMHDALIEKYKKENPYLYILDIFHVKEKGVVVTGYIIGNNIQVNDVLSLEKADGRNLETSCIDINDHPSRVVQIQLSKLAISEVSQGDRLVRV